MKTFKLPYKDFFNWQLGVDFLNKYESMNFLIETVAASSYYGDPLKNFSVKILFYPEFWERLEAENKEISKKILSRFVRELEANHQLENFANTVPDNQHFADAISYTMSDHIYTRIRAEFYPIIEAGQQLSLDKLTPQTQVLAKMLEVPRIVLVTKDDDDYVNRLRSMAYNLSDHYGRYKGEYRIKLDRRDVIDLLLTPELKKRHAKKLYDSLDLNNTTKTELLTLMGREKALQSMVAKRLVLKEFNEIYPAASTEEILKQLTKEQKGYTKNFLVQNNILSTLSQSQLMQVILSDSEFAMTQDIYERITDPEVQKKICQRFISRPNNDNYKKFPKSWQHLWFECDYSNMNYRYDFEDIHKATGLGKNPEFCRQMLKQNNLEMAEFCMGFSACNNKEDLLKDFIEKSKGKFDESRLHKSKLLQDEKFMAKMPKFN